MGQLILSCTTIKVLYTSCCYCLVQQSKYCTWVLVSFKTSVLLACSSHLAKVKCYMNVAPGSKQSFMPYKLDIKVWGRSYQPPLSARFAITDDFSLSFSLIKI